MDVSAKITGIKYTPLLCRILKAYDISDLASALSKYASFLLNIKQNKQIALSWWVSAKRTRSYPYSRVYDTLSFDGKKVTIIPIMKDEGKEGDRDFLQWDTVSLMSLMGIYVIIGYYKDAEKSEKYMHKITNQRFDIQHIKEEIMKIISYQSDALHWNLAQIENVGDIAEKAINSYEIISKVLGVEMHSQESARKRINELLKGMENFMMLSRDLAKKAQNRESITVQPKEKLSGVKATLTIKNYLGGYYFFTCDEVDIEKNTIYLIECKHSKQSFIPSLEDIKDGLVKMILFTNLKEVKIGDLEYSPISVLKLTSNLKFSRDNLRKSQIDFLRALKRETKENNFRVVINDRYLQEIDI
jgi:vacuolar-type H+-ATPase subunit F/Vma7